MDSKDRVSEIRKEVNVLPVVETIPADLLTPLAVYLKLSANASYSFLLESVEGGISVARYSFIGADPEMIVSGNDHRIVLTDPNGNQQLEQPLFDFLREHFSVSHAATDPDLPSFIGGAIGYLGFSCVDWFEPSLRSDLAAGETTEAAFMIFHSIVAFDHAKQVIKIITLVFADAANDEKDIQGLVEAAETQNSEIRKLLEDPQYSLPARKSNSTNVVPESNWTRSDFEHCVDRIKELIKAGECYQVVLSQRFTKRTSASDVAVYRALRSLNPSPYMFLLRFKDRSIIGASPEMLVRCEGEQLEYRPIAGTRPRGATPDEDASLADEMRNDIKEVAEHMMLVDLGRNDLGRIAKFGSVCVAELMKVEKYSHVQHLVSSLTARLRKGFDRFDVLGACFPAGTVSGAPKVRAIEIIRELEPDERGVYSGAVGYFDYSENMDTCIAIRTLVLEGGVAKIQAGAGIVADSVPKNEYDETVNKAKALLKAVEIAERGSP